MTTKNETEGQSLELVDTAMLDLITSVIKKNGGEYLTLYDDCSGGIQKSSSVPGEPDIYVIEWNSKQEMLGKLI